MTDGSSHSATSDRRNTAHSGIPVFTRTGAYRNTASGRTFPWLTIIVTLLAAVLVLVIMASAKAANAPSGLTATAGDTQVTLTWNDPNDSTITGYRVLWMEPTDKLDDPSKENNPHVSVEGGDMFGQSVGIDGGRAVVGAPFQESRTNANQNVEDGGWAHAYSRSSGEWSYDEFLAVSNPQEGGRLGNGVAMAGRTAVAGAPSYYQDPNADPGRVTIAAWDSTTESWDSKFSATGVAGNDFFGTSVAIDGGIAVVGAPGVAVGSDTYVGKAYVFTRNSSNQDTGVWSQETVLDAGSNAGQGTVFGTSVAVDGNTIVVGASGEDTYTGAAYVFTKSNNVWSRVARLTAPNRQIADAFGGSVAIDGDTIVVGAQGWDGGAQGSPRYGAAFVFTKNNNVWSRVARLTASDYAAQDQFGFAVAVEGDTIVVGDYQDDDDDDGDDSGSVYLFTKPSGGWGNADETVQLTGPNGAAGNKFGFSVAARGGRFIVGAPGVASDKGAAYMYSIPRWTDISVPASNSGTMSHTVTGLDNAVAYTFWVVPVVSGNLGPASDSVTATPTAAKAATPATLTALGIDQEVTLSWDDPNDASIIRYRYQQKESDGTFGSWNDIELTDIDSSETGKLKYTVSNLTNGTTYTFQIFAKDNHEDSGISAEASATPAPPPPLPLVPPFVSNIGQVTDISVGVDADLSRDQAQQFSTGADEAGYVLGSIDLYFQRGTDREDLTVTVWNTNANTDPGSTLHTLTNPDTIEPGLVRFTDPANAQLAANTHYFVHVAFSGSGTPPRLRTTASTNVDAGAAPNWSMTSYRHQVDTSSATGWAYQSNLLKISVNEDLDPPVAPANFETTVGNGQVVLSWDDPEDDYITKYQYSTDGGTSYTDIALTDINSIDIDSSEKDKFKYTIENLPNGARYNLAVRAVNSAGNGTASTKTVVMMPTAPTGFTATPRDQRVELSWDDPKNGTITKYQYSTDGGTNFADILDSDASTTSYNVTVLSDSTETALANGTTYTLAVRAVNPSDAGPASTGTATPMPTPAAPSGLSATPGDGRVTLSWTDPGDASITKYQYSTDYMIGGGNGNIGVGTFNDIDLTSLDSTSDPGFIKYTVTGLDNGVTYPLALRAVNPYGEGAPSTVNALMVPAAPKLSAAPGDGLVVLSWDDPDNLTISEYQLPQSDPPGWSKITGSNATTTTHTVTRLTNYTGYSFQVRAVNETGIGPASNSASATPRLPKPAKPAGLGAAAGDKQVTLKWTDPIDSTIDKYQISEVIPEDFLTAAGGAAGAHFGISVAINGDTAVVGADRANSRKGLVYIFTRESTGNWTQQAKLDGENDGDQFGWSVAVDGDTVVVGAHAYDGDGVDADGNPLVNSGAVYVFTKPDTDTNSDGLTDWKDWKYLDDDGKAALTAKLTPTDPEAYAFFGGSVALDGNTLAIGARLSDVEGYFNAGAAYVFTKSGSTWSQQAKLTASIPRQLAALGYSLAVDGNTVLVGAYGDDTVLGELGSGSAYVFDKPSGGWTDGNETAKLTAPDRQPSGYFGFSVALDGDTAVIGARQHGDPGTGAGSGAAYVFTRESGVWGEKAKLTPSDAAAGDNFGVSVAVEDGTVVVGSWQDDDNGRNSGSAYVFEKPDLGWASTLETLKLTAPDGAVNDRFGWSVAVDLDGVRGDLALVGAYSDDTAAALDAGSVHVLGIPDWNEITGSAATTIAHTVSKELDDSNSDLTNGMEYNFQIRALNESGPGPASDSVSATPLGPPASLNDLMSEGGDTQVTLSWTAATADATIAPITQYEYQYQVEQSVGTFGNWTNWANIPDSGPTTTEYTKTRIENKDHKFRVRAVNVIGEGPASTVDATPASATPAAPNLTATAGDTQVKLEWPDPNDSSIDKWQYRRRARVGQINWGSWGSWADVSVVTRDTIMGYTETGLTNGTEYEFEVRAWDEQASTQNGPAGKDDATPMGVDTNNLPIPPAKPTGLTATGGHNQVTLSWDDPDDSSIDRYEYRQKAGDANSFGAWTRISGSGPATTEYTVTLLTNGVTYTFEIQAVDVVDPNDESLDELSGESNSATATPLPPPPGRPAGLNAVPGNRMIDLNWNDPDNPTITKYEVKHFLNDSKLTRSGGREDDKFGYSVAVDGDTAVIGAYQVDGNGQDSGAAYVFTRSDGVWSQAGKLTASDGEAYDNFGISVAVDGDTVVIGASGDNDNGADSGSAYVFVKPSGGWADGNETAKLTASDGEALDYFGYSVAVNGDTVLVGAYQDDDGDDSEDSGSAYLFVKPNTDGGWADWADGDMEAAKLTPSEAEDDDNFGIAVALDDDTAVIGAPGDDDDGIDSGAAYVFVRVSGTWSRQTKLTAGGEDADFFGYSVALDVDIVVENSVTVKVATVVVGAYLDDREDDDTTTDVDETAIDAGSAYVFTRDSSGSWSRQAKFSADDGEAEDWFGYSVAVDGDAVVVGAFGDDDNGSNSGSAYVFSRDSSGQWSQTNKLSPYEGEEDDRFGYAVAVDTESHTALVGAGSAHVLDIHDWAEIPGSTADTTSHTVAGLYNGRMYDFQVRAVNLASAGPPAADEATPVTNGAPSFVDGDSVTRSVTENTAAGGNVGSAVAATDLDNDTLAYSLSGTGASSFAIHSSTGQIIVGPATTLDYELGPRSYSVTVSVHDGKDSDGNTNSETDDTIEVTIIVTDADEGGNGNRGGNGNGGVPVNNAPSFNEGDSTVRTVPENAAVSTAVGGPVIAIDGDNDPLEYSLLGTDQASFDVDLGTAQLTTKTMLNYEVQNEYSVQVRVRDGRGGFDAINLTINVVDVDEPPSQPGAPLISADGRTRLTVGWTAPDNQGPEIRGYNVRYREAGGEFQDAGHSGIGTSVTLQGLKPGGSYEVQVRAVNAEGMSSWSESGQGETGEAQPTPTPTPEPAATPAPTSTPEPAATPAPTREPTSTPVPAPTVTLAPSPGSTVAPVPVPTATPAIEAATKPVPLPTSSPGRAGTGPPTRTLRPAATPTTMPTATLVFTPQPDRTSTPVAIGAVTTAPTPTVRPAPPQADSGEDGGFPWWVILLILVGAIIALLLFAWTRRRRDRASRSS